ncbi:MAG: serine/threonine protein kinase [Gemmatimonadaceae bacterium]|nr:serine/threonine protein kinase [Gemmatimonadaceae bacterium]
MTNTDAMTWPEPAPSLARAVAGEFRLIREIGRGGMGVVYLARDTRLDRDVAIKTLPPHLAADAQVRERFVREARTAAALSHPNIVPIHAAAERDGVVYFVMGYVDGRSTAEVIGADGPLDTAASLAVVRQIAAGLEVAHARGVVHRDIKAENVLIDATGHAMITDFGIARVAEVQPLTATGTVLGSVHYMSPEQVTGDVIDGRSDLYALGVLWFHLLSGRFPFERPTSSAILVAHVNSAPASLTQFVPAVPPGIVALLDALLAKSAEARPASARAVLDALSSLRIDDPPALPAVIAQSYSVDVLPDGPLSSTEANAVWARAAQLQAYTGVQAPPAELVTPREGPLTTAYDADLVRAAAQEAGIDTKYVERALAERKSVAMSISAAPMAMPMAVPMAVQVGERQQKRPNWFLGAHTKLDFQASFPAEIDVSMFEDIADDIRDSMGEMVSVNAVGRTLTVMTNVMRPGQSGMPRAAQVQVAVRNGRTTVRAFEDLSQLAGGLFGGLGGGGGGGFGAVVMGLVMKTTQNVPLGLTAWASTIAVALIAARLIYAHNARKKEQELRSVVERIVARILASRAEALPPGTNFKP